MADPLLRLRGITRVYGEGEATVHALAGVDLELARGEFVALMGPSGSGKSTLLNTIGVLDLPTAGSYLYRGLEVTQLSRHQRALMRRHWLGFVFQGFNLLPRNTALENVEMPLIYRQVPRADRLRRAAKALSEVGLGDRIDHRPDMLSGGQQQRVAIARALVTTPDILLADEPTGNLDTTTSAEIMEVLVRMNEVHGVTIVMVTHEHDMAAYTQRIVHLVDGVVQDDRRVA